MAGRLIRGGDADLRRVKYFKFEDLELGIDGNLVVKNKSVNYK